MKNSLELKDEKAQLKRRAKEIMETCKLEIRDFNKEEREEINSIKKEIGNINIELRNLEQTLNTKTIMEFRLIKAINDIANNRNLDEVAKAVTNKGMEEMRKSGVSYSG